MAHALVSGGGIGGLATALSLARHGHRATVLERRDAFTEMGAGIQLGPNAFHALDLLGLSDQVQSRAVFIDELRFMDGVTGETVITLPLTGRYRARFKNPYAVVQRVDLYEPLLSACRTVAGVELVSGASVASHAQHPTGVTVRTADGRTFAGDLLVGADGIRSTVRARLVGDGAPRISGHTIYRSVIPIERVPPRLRWNAVTLWAGPKWHFVHYAIGNGRYLNLAATLDDGARDPVAGRRVPQQRVRHRFRHLGHSARQLLDLGEDWHEWVLCDRDPVAVWSDGRVTLMGDAAHAMLQYAAQGACQALEDAVVLGDVLADAAADVPQRLAEFNAVRRERTARVQLLARQMGEQLFHPTGEEARARNTMLRALSEDDLHGYVAWLHGARDFAARPGNGE